MKKGVSMSDPHHTQSSLSSVQLSGQRLGENVPAHTRSRFRTAEALEGVLKITPEDYGTGRYRVLLYRFLANQLPIISACIWTWVRLASAPGEFQVEGSSDGHFNRRAQERLRQLSDRLHCNPLGNRIGMVSLLPELFTGLFRDGIFGSFLTVAPDGSGVDRIIPVDALHMVREANEQGYKLGYETEGKTIDLDRADFYYIALTNSPSEPFGRSILQPVPFVSYIEQQLVSDMQRSAHNSGYTRLHVKVAPPERMAGESDSAYTDRINGYFDATVDMIRQCEIDENPVTWNNVEIAYIGPDKSRAVTNSWFMNHRAMIEDICAGTNLSPFLLGYSYGATTTWSNFKFDIVMRQVRSVQAEVAHFLEWVGNIDLALAGIDARCRFVFDNNFAYQAIDQVAIESKRIENLLKAFQAGLVDESTAREKLERLLCL
jgi:hypothetical protein